MRRDKSPFRFKLTESFFTISHLASGAYKEKGSKFIAFAHPVADSEQIRARLEEIRKEYYDARHYCYAWILGPDKSQFKAFDDGEPNHSAGDPILNQIKSKNLTNVLVVVVRYFGGVKLGVSGLTNAYKVAASEALKNATIVEHILTKRLILRYGYPETSQVKSLIKEYDLNIVQESFDEICSVTVEIRISKEERLKSKVETLSLQGFKIIVG